MPELPEVETIRRQLAPHLEGRRIEVVEILDARWTRPFPPETVADGLTGAMIEQVSRAGKYLIWELSGELFLLVHLRMTGALLFDPALEPVHTRARFALSGGHRLVYVDPRRFGTGHLLAGASARDAYLEKRLGAEPFTPAFTTDVSALGRSGSGGTDQGIRAGPAPDRWRREHLRRRGAVPRSHPPAPARRATDHGPVGAPAGHDRGGTERGHRREGCLDRRLPPCRRRPRLVPGSLSDPSASRRALHRVRATGAQDRRRRSWDLRVRALPAATAAAASFPGTPARCRVMAPAPGASCRVMGARPDASCGVMAPARTHLRCDGARPDAPCGATAPARTHSAV